MRTSVEDLGTGRGSIHMRPQRFFDEEGRVSEVVMVSSEVPPEIIDGIGGEACRKRVAARVERYVALAQAKLRARRAGFMGLEKAKRLSAWRAHGTSRRSASPEPINWPASPVASYGLVTAYTMLGAPSHAAAHSPDSNAACSNTVCVAFACLSGG